MLLCVCRKWKRNLNNGVVPIQPTPESNELSLRVGLTIKALRTELGVSQEKFSELTGHHRTYIGFLERGERTPNIYTLLKVAQALNIELSELLKKAGY